jgi:hypothetical protein
MLLISNYLGHQPGPKTEAAQLILRCLSSLASCSGGGASSISTHYSPRPLRSSDLGVADKHEPCQQYNLTSSVPDEVQTFWTRSRVDYLSRLDLSYIGVKNLSLFSEGSMAAMKVGNIMRSVGNELPLADRYSDCLGTTGA